MSLLRRYWSTDYSLTALLLFLCLNLFVVLPLGNLQIGGRLFVSLLFSLIFISGVGAVAKSRLTTALAGGVVLAGLAVHWLRLSSVFGRSLLFLDACISTFFCTILALVVLVQVFSAGPITSHRIQGAIAAYLLFGLACAFGYNLISLEWPPAFIPPIQEAVPSEDLPLRFVYFSFVTLTTVGYGDITAVHPFARALAILEALLGQLFPTILLARLVSMELYYRQATHLEHR
jgi:ion channel